MNGAVGFVSVSHSLPTKKAHRTVSNRCKVRASTSRNETSEGAPVILSQVSRRSMLALSALALAGATVPPSWCADNATAAEGSALVLPPLPYAYDALEPAIDRETMILHHDKHFAKYVRFDHVNAFEQNYEWAKYTEGANAALAKIPGAKARVNGEPAKLAGLLADLESIPDESVRQALRNNGGGYLNHFQFFATMCAPDIERGSTGPEGELGDAIAERFGSFAEFRDAFTKKSKSLFGSGFVYLVKDGKDGGNLAIKSFPNQDSPVMSADMPILGLDLWEHAYYKKYSNRRAEYIDAWWTVVNWKAVQESYWSKIKPAA